MLQDTITKCVLATQQTYVEALKKEGKFDLEAQKAAFKQTYDAVLNLLDEEAQIYLENIMPDLTLYITNAIESQIYENKK